MTEKGLKMELGLQKNKKKKNVNMKNVYYIKTKNRRKKSFLKNSPGASRGSNSVQRPNYKR